MQNITLVQKNTNGRVKFIQLELEGDTVSRTWGLVDGKTQQTSNTYDFINKGKANQLDPVQAAKEDYERIIQTKTKEGYLVTDALDTLPKLGDDVMDFDELPVQFCCSKPNTKILDKKANLLIKNKNSKYMLKYNGLCSYILITPKREVKIYTRRIDDFTSKFPSIVEAVKKLNLPANTLLVTEFVIDPDLNIPHMEAFKLMSSISRSDTLKGKVKEDVTHTLFLQEEHPVKAVVFNVLFYDSKNLTNEPYSVILNDYFPMFGPNNPIQDKLITPFSMEFNTHEDAILWAEENKLQYEGLVLWEMDANAEITFNGKPSRRACYKVKASQDDDVVAYGFNEGTGDHQGKIGSLKIGKYDSDGNLVDLGKCGSGIADDMCDPILWTFPCVVEIKYDQRFPTGKYQFPRFSCVHLEKVPTDIILDDDLL